MDENDDNICGMAVKMMAMLGVWGRRRYHEAGDRDTDCYW